MEKEVVLTGTRTSATTGKPVQFIRVREWELKYGIKTGMRTGFLEIEPLHAAEAKKAIEDNKVQLAFGNFNRQNNTYDIQAIFAEEAQLAPGAVAQTGELQHK